MNTTRQLLIRLGKWENTGIILLVLVLLALHFATIMRPPDLVFDEQYYVPSARDILQSSGTERIEHPLVGQLLIVSGLRLFGDNPFGWRFFPIMFGITGLLLFYFICKRLKMASRYAYLATFLLSFENLSFIQSSVAMLDVFSLTFMMASLWFYLGNRYACSGVMAGLATLCKLTGFLVVPIIILHWLIMNRNKPSNLITLVVLPPVTFFLLTFLLSFIVWHKWLNPFDQMVTMLNIYAGSTFAHYPSEMLSRPWEWLLLPKILTYWVEPHYLAMISPPIWVLIMPAVLFIAFKAIKGDRVAIFTLIWFGGAYLVWIPVSLITDRMSYIYYFYPAVGAVCIGLSLMMTNLESIARNSLRGRYRRMPDIILIIYMLLCLGAFVILSPVSFWWKTPLCVLAYFMARYQLSAKRMYGTQEQEPVSGV